MADIMPNLPDNPATDRTLKRECALSHGVKLFFNSAFSATY